MQATRQADYAVHAILYLAQLEPGTRASTALIAHEQHIPPTFLAKIISQLSTAGIVQATRGAHGGVTLGRPADAISLLEIVEAIDGPIMLNECTLNPGVCGFSDSCAIREVWVETRAKLVQRLAGVNFGQLARSSQTIQVSMAVADAIELDIY